MYLVYILQSGSLTYVGMTNDFFRRLRQHNKEIKGGAKYTQKRNHWIPILIIDGFLTKREACQCEWKLKRRYTEKNISSSERRIKHAYQCLQQKKWTTRSPLIKDQKLIIYIIDEYKFFFNNYYDYPVRELYF